MDNVDFIRWLAMILAAGAAWLVGSQSQRKRNIGFWLCFLSNALWMENGSQNGPQTLTS